MIDKYRRTSLFLPLPAFFSLLGIIFCAWRANGETFNICFSTGCTLFQDMTINGISMWYIGLLVFAIFFIFSVTGRLLLAKISTAIALFIDAILLTIMLYIAPCTSCIIIAFFFGCIYISFRTIYSRNKISAFKSVLFIVWSLLFIANLGFLLKSESSNYIIYGPEKASIKMYFAPSCKSCREGVIALAANNNVAFYPVNNDKNDVYLIALMAKYIKAGKNIEEALNEAFLAKKEDYELNYFSYGTLLLHFRLLKNKAHVIEASGGAIPYFEFKGLPKALINGDNGKKLSFKNERANSNSDYRLPIELELEGSCGGEDAKPCP